MKIGITGPISEINFGDYAMLVNNMYDLGKEHSYTLFHYSRIDATSFNQINDLYFDNFNVKKVQIDISLNNQDTFLNKLKRYILRKFGISQNKYIYTPIEILNLVDDFDKSILESIKELDVLIVNGGGYFNKLWYNWGRQNDLLSIIYPILVANIFKKKIIFTGNGFGPFDETAKFFLPLFNSLTNVKFGVRDKLLSKAYLNTLSIYDDKINEIPDDLMIINKQLLKNVNLGIPFDKYILLELYFSVEELKKQEADIIEFAKRIKEKFDFSIVFIPLATKSGGEIQGEYLKSILPNDSFFLYDINKYGIVRICDLIYLSSNAELVIGSRYHSLILALGQKTPVISLIKTVSEDYRYYYNKNIGALDLVFENQTYDPLQFTRIGHESIFREFKGIDFINVINYQNSLIQNDKYQEKLQELKLNRKSYFEDISNNPLCI